MASDRRWTGGTANRDWSAGVAVTTEVPAEGVKAYLADCRRHRAILQLPWHPDEDMAVKVVFHRTNAGRQFIRDEFHRLIATPLEAVPRP